MDAKDIDDLIAGYALDALSPEDERTVEDYLAHHDEARAELASLTETASALAYATETPQPPPALRDRILDQARSERQNVVPLRPRWAVPAAALAAAAAVAAIAFGVWAATLHHDLAGARQAGAIASVVPLSGQSGSLVVARNGEAALVTPGLTGAPAGKTYQAWVIAGSAKPLPAGVFPGGSTILEIRVPKGAVVAVTVEPAGGSLQPTTTPLFQSRPV